MKQIQICEAGEILLLRLKSYYSYRGLRERIMQLRKSLTIDRVLDFL